MRTVIGRGMVASRDGYDYLFEFTTATSAVSAWTSKSTAGATFSNGWWRAESAPPSFSGLEGLVRVIAI
ncbi:hypothetical protein [Mycolicibacterium gilvum]|jgi:hypothetical protein|uniref:hypothetical protein n=1 Tax=Mycolicibacterium gilvum TaxID=1804 RepID=UPI000E1C37F8|nr:hypothetical protein [Mycolicibacterium gilvum]MCV7054880.1 hypothetical protein [Mycolicibacterium gilvum]